MSTKPTTNMSPASPNEYCDNGTHQRSCQCSLPSLAYHCFSRLPALRQKGMKLDQEKLLAVAVAAEKELTPDVWAKSFEAVNMHPDPLLSFDTWCSRISADIAAAEDGFEPENLDYLAKIAVPPWFKAMPDDAQRELLILAESTLGGHSSTRGEVRGPPPVIEGWQEARGCVQIPQLTSWPRRSSATSWQKTTLSPQLCLPNRQLEPAEKLRDVQRLASTATPIRGDRSGTTSRSSNTCCFVVLAGIAADLTSPASTWTWK